MKISAFLSLVVFLCPTWSFADDLCESRESLRKRVTYCHENFEYIPAAEACSGDFQKLVAAEQAKLQALLGARVRGASGTAQNQDFNTSDQVLASTLDELNYLIDYGKQVHTEIEDYAYAMVLPIYDEEDARGSLADPEVKARFMDRDCFGLPTKEMEKLGLQLRPVIQELEDTRSKVVSLKQATEQSESHLDALKSDTPAGGSPTFAKGVDKTSFKGKPAPRSDSTITGNIKHQDLPDTGSTRSLSSEPRAP